MPQNAIPDSDVAARIALEALAKRGADHAGEVRRLLDAALAVMRNGGTSRARVADIVAAAGVSNDAFYRYFPSKDALVAALLEDGAARLLGYLGHQMAKEATPEAKVRRWVEGVLSQAEGEVAETTIAVLSNSGGVEGGGASGRHFAAGPLATLLREPFAELGSTDPELDASVMAHAVLGKMSDHLWARTHPSPAEAERIVELCLAAVRGERKRRRR
jgi:AcrR family transcriptional regulator